MKKRLLAAALSVMMVAVLVTGCGSSSGSEESKDTEKTEASGGGLTELHAAADADPGSVAPYGTEGPRNATMFMVYESLGCMSSDNQNFELVLAKSVEEVEDNVYDVEIYDYIYDSEGNHMTASDVVFCFDLYIQQGFTPQYVTSLDSIEKTGDYTVRITMKEGTKVGAFETMCEKVRLITQAAWEASPDQMQTKPVGTAHYVLSEYNSGESLVFKKNEDYWQTDESLWSTYQEAYADTVYYEIITDRSTQAIALEAGEIDMSQYIQGADVDNFMNTDGTAKDGWTVYSCFPGSMFSLVFNCGDASPCKDENLRKAIAYAIDSAQVMYTGYTINGIAAKQLISPFVGDYVEAREKNSYYEYDEDKAKELLADSGYNGETIVILVDPNFPSESATLIGSYLDAAGIKTDIQIYEQAMYQTMHMDNSGTQYDIDLVGTASTGYAWSQVSDYDNGLHDNGLSHQMIKDDELQRLYDEMASVTGNSEETVTAFLDYAEEHCYSYALGYKQKNNIADADKITTIATNEWGDLLLGACH